MKIAVNEPPDGEVDDPKPPVRLGRGGSISCCSRGRSFEKKVSHATPASDEGGGLARAVLTLASRADAALIWSCEDAVFDRFSVAGAVGADEDEDAGELLLPEDEPLLPLPAALQELLAALDEEHSTDEEARRD